MHHAFSTTVPGTFAMDLYGTGILWSALSKVGSLHSRLLKEIPKSRFLIQTRYVVLDSSPPNPIILS